MKAIDVYRQAIKRTFANLYDESPDEVDVTWGNADDTITVHCSHKTFTHEILSNDNDKRSNSSATMKTQSPSR